MRRSLLLASFLVFAAIAGAGAAELTDSDYAYLHDNYGLGRDSGGLAGLQPEEAARLHALINDPDYRSRPAVRDDNVARYLYEVETCVTWKPPQEGAPCPRAFRSSDPAVAHGYQLAERNCLFCHLTGTTVAPSFYKLSRRGGWDATRIAQAISHGHAMSPITLQPDEIRDLAAYISALK